MAKRKKRKSKKSETLKRTMKFELIALIILALAVISIAKLGAVGKATVLFFRFFMGEWYMLSLIGLVIFSGYLMWKRSLPYLFHTKLIGIYLIISSLLLLSHVTLFQLLSNGGKFDDPSVIANTWELFRMEVRGETSTTDLGGGMLGAIFFALFYYLFDEAGSKIVAFLLIIIGFVLITGKTFGDAAGKMMAAMLNFCKKQWAAFIDDMKEWKQNSRARREERQSRREEEQQALQHEEEPETVITINNTAEPAPEPIISSFAERAYQEDPQEAASNQVQEAAETEPEDENAPPITFTEVENKDYELPPIRLLKLPRQTDQSGEYELIHANAAKLERTFQSFGVKARVTQVHLGPAVTKYEVHPDVGVKVSKIVSLNDDLALALAAKDIRIEAPIPGKSAIGIEVPNSEVAMVSLREVIESKQNDKPDSKLLIGLGRDITGEAVLAELNKMPHLLVAGATGSGKSVCINGIITSILMRAKPHEVN